MRTEEDLEVAFNNGDLSDSEMDAYLVGADVDSDTEGSEQEDETEKGSLPEKTDEKEVEQEKEVVKSEPVVLAKDGVHTIPYSEFKSARDEEKRLAADNAILSAKLDEQNSMLEKLKVAQEEDEESGTTEATDELMSDLEEDYPGTAKEFKALQEQVKSLLAKVEGNETATAELTAQQNFDNEISDLNPDYKTVKDSEDFWNWLDDQPRSVRDVQSSGDPQKIADTVKLYTDSQKTPAAGSDKTGAAKEAVKKAMDKASRKSTVQTLSDVPGGSSPATDAMEAFHRLPEAQQLDKLMAMDETARNDFMNKLV